MSELTKCNCCKLTDLIREAGRDGLVVRITHRPKSNYPRGVDVHIHPDGIDNPTSKRYFKAWFAELTEHCAC